LGVTFTFPRMWESERMGPNIPKWILTSRIGIPIDF
jgi:hypothetical protein